MSLNNQVNSLNGEYYDLGDFHRPIETTSTEAQTWFNRGLVWCYGFNHEEATRCFKHAIKLDPNCAMAYWGLAYALGPNYNKPWDLFAGIERQTTAEQAHDAVNKAKACATSPVEKALVDALYFRYPKAQSPTKEDRPIWNKEYADAMSKVSAQYPDDLDISALYADAMMNLTPWALWDFRTGEPSPEARTIETKRVLDYSLGLEGGVRHPGVLHYYIHLMEMSKTPEAALPAANHLRGLIPDSGHLNHMPSHIDILCGDYGRAVVANTDAVIADEKFLLREGPMNFYTLYRSHDYHYRLYAAMFSGQSKIALDTVQMLESSFSEDLLRVESPPMADWLEAFLGMRVHVLIRFGRWTDILSLAFPEDQELLCSTTALIHYAKAMAHAALGQVEEARKQRALFADFLPTVKHGRTLFKNRMVDLLKVAEAMMDGEIEYRAGDQASAFAHLNRAINIYDNLPFDEPWGWMQPVRHAYGALSLEQGLLDQALEAYRGDLGLDDSLPRIHQHPNNVWALHGYHECLVRMGRLEEARAVEPKLKAAMDIADVPINSSCFCRLRTGVRI